MNLPTGELLIFFWVTGMLFTVGFTFNVKENQNITILDSIAYLCSSAILWPLFLGDRLGTFLMESRDKIVNSIREGNNECLFNDADRTF